MVELVAKKKLVYSRFGAMVQPDPGPSLVFAM
jgi:hypothetical protein